MLYNNTLDSRLIVATSLFQKSSVKNILFRVNAGGLQILKAKDKYDNTINVGNVVNFPSFTSDCLRDLGEPINSKQEDWEYVGQLNIVEWLEWAQGAYQGRS